LNRLERMKEEKKGKKVNAFGNNGKNGLMEEEKK
jgi:hypothetical protein